MLYDIHNKIQKDYVWLCMIAWVGSFCKTNNLCLRKGARYIFVIQHLGSGLLCYCCHGQSTFSSVSTIYFTPDAAYVGREVSEEFEPEEPQERWDSSTLCLQGG